MIHDIIYSQLVTIFSVEGHFIKQLGTRSSASWQLVVGRWKFDIESELFVCFLMSLSYSSFNSCDLLSGSSTFGWSSVFVLERGALENEPSDEFFPRYTVTENGDDGESACKNIIVRKEIKRPAHTHSANFWDPFVIGGSGALSSSPMSHS